MPEERTTTLVSLLNGRPLWVLSVRHTRERKNWETKRRGARRVSRGTVSGSAENLGRARVTEFANDARNELASREIAENKTVVHIGLS